MALCDLPCLHRRVTLAFGWRSLLLHQGMRFETISPSKSRVVLDAAVDRRVLSALIYLLFGNS
jgi:hypothetical protein